MTPDRISNQTARRLFLDHHLLLQPNTGASTQGLVDHLGFVQLDSVNTLARAHDLICWSRRQTYRAPDLLKRVEARTGFEHWTHDASVIAMDHWPMWRHKFAREKARMDHRWPAIRRPGFMEKLDDVRRHISDHGECTSMDVGQDEEKKSQGWWDWHPSKTALEYLWRAGEISVTRRDGFRKVYDLTERVIPDEQRAVHTTYDQMIDWACTSALDRLGFATSGEIAAFYDLITAAEAKAWCANAQKAGTLRPVVIEAHDGALRSSFILAKKRIETPPTPGTRVRLLSPFDPALRDRKRAERLFGFHYRVEMFVPAAKRQYGYYVFPVLQGDRMIGRLDAKRHDDGIAVTAFWPEPCVKMGKARLRGLQAELDRVARFVGANSVTWAKGWLK